MIRTQEARDRRNQKRRAATAAKIAARPMQACRQCGTMFRGRTKFAVFCTPACKYQNDRLKYGSIPGLCRACGKPFEPRRADAVYCSAECGKSYGARMARDSAEIRNCIECGVEFKRVRSTITCSHTCAKRRHHRLKLEAERERIRRRNDARKASRTCEVCAIEFRTNYKKKKTCSTKCAAELIRRNARLRSRRNYAKEQAKAPVVKRCVYCENVFTPELARQKCCSAACVTKMKSRGAAITTSKRAQKHEDYAAGFESAALAEVKPQTIPCPACRAEVNRDVAVAGCCSQQCVDDLKTRYAVRSLDDVAVVGSRVLVRGYKRMTIDGMERMIANGDAGIIVAIEDGMARIMTAGVEMVYPHVSIVTTPTVVQIVKERIKVMEQWRGKFREAKREALA